MLPVSNVDEDEEEMTLTEQLKELADKGSDQESLMQQNLRLILSSTKGA